MESPGIVRFVKLTISGPELERLGGTQRKRYIMLTSILRDLQLLSKFLLFIGKDQPSKVSRCPQTL